MRREIALKLMDMLFRAAKGEMVSDDEIDRIVEEMTPEEIDEATQMILEALMKSNHSHTPSHAVEENLCLAI